MLTGDDVKPGFIVMITGDPNKEGKFYRVKNKEGSEYKTNNTTGTAEFSSVATTLNSGFKNIDRLEPDTDQMAWYSWYVKDGGRYQMKLKAGTIRFGPEEEPNVGYIDNERSGPQEPNPRFSFWLIKDWYPSINHENRTLYTVTPEIFFEGWKFDLELVDDIRALQIRASGKFSIVVLGGVKTN